jgi:hypothetical protein
VAISIGSFQISRNSIVLQFVPAVVAYLILQMQMDTVRSVEMRVAFSQLFEKWSAGAAAEDMHLLVHSPMPIYWNIHGGAGRSTNRPSTWIVSLIISISMMTLLAIGALAFEVQAYYLLYEADLVGSASLNISAAAAAFFVVGFIAYNVVLVISGAPSTSPAPPWVMQKVSLTRFRRSRNGLG